MSLVWGVTPLLSTAVYTEREVYLDAINIGLENGYIKEGDLIAITAGAPVGVAAMTNMLRIHIVGNMI